MALISSVAFNTGVALITVDCGVGVAAFTSGGTAAAVSSAMVTASSLGFWGTLAAVATGPVGLVILATGATVGAAQEIDISSIGFQDGLDQDHFDLASMENDFDASVDFVL